MADNVKQNLEWRPIIKLSPEGDLSQFWELLTRLMISNDSNVDTSGPLGQGS